MQPDQSPPPLGPLPQYPSDEQSADYSFILNPNAPKSGGLKLTGGSVLKRVLVAVGGLLILIIAFIVVKGLLASSSFSKPDYLAVVEQQAEISHILNTDLSNNPQELASLSTNSSNFAVTAQLVISSAETQTITYLKTNGYSLKSTVIDNIYSKDTDTELTDALTTNSFNQVFATVMQSELTTYANDLTRAYNNSTGQKGRALLKTEYSSTALLLKQLNSPTS